MCVCPVCGSPTRVLETRKLGKTSLRRRRRCTKDPEHGDFSTLESLVGDKTSTKPETIFNSYRRFLSEGERDAIIRDLREGLSVKLAQERYRRSSEVIQSLSKTFDVQEPLQKSDSEGSGTKTPHERS